ncbi:cytochrome P450 52A12 [Patellaria atrata CBS 101060]|uniref:Cytochrome P450 52A12 n=1 Tax=Patellaria atrata CBS 101060 TaxID=1346257 RepID=A0A9P4S4P5_9PEZI|nr:cytochrome P450 52A12 [Patellaria atrata CBS 101060]
MATSLLILLSLLPSYILYLYINRLLRLRRERLAAKRLHCQHPPFIRNRWPFGLEGIGELKAADEGKYLPDCFLERHYAVARQEGKDYVATIAKWFCGQYLLQTTDPELIKAVLATQFKEFGLGEARIGNFKPLLGNGIFSADGAQWEHARTLLRPQFAREQVSDLELEEAHIQHLMRALPVNKDGWTNWVDIKSLFFRLTLDSATEFLFGESVKSQLAALPGYKLGPVEPERDGELFAYAFDRSQQLIANGFRYADYYWLFGHTKEFHAMNKICRDFIDYYVRLALQKRTTDEKTFDSGKRKYIFLEALAEHSQDPVEIRSQLLSILLAGRDTTASLLSWLFLLLLQPRNKPVYAKLRTAVLDAFGSYSNPKKITFANLKSCNYLQWCLNETLRLYPVVPFNARRALVSTTLPHGGGFDGKSPIYIPKGTEVMYSVYSMHRRRDIWGSDATEFNPERWQGRKTGWEYLPFNGGPRICIGQQFALTEAGYVAVRLVQRFESIEGHDAWVGERALSRNGLALTSCPADGVRLRLKEGKE